jgi:hypothetical protein
MSENDNEIETIRRPKPNNRRSNHANAGKNESENADTTINDSDNSQASRPTTVQNEIRTPLEDDLEFSLNFQARFFAELLIDPLNPSSSTSQALNQPSITQLTGNQSNAQSQVNKSIIDLTKETNDDIQIICTTSPNVNRPKSKPNRIRNENASTSTNQNDDSPVLIQEIRADNCKHDFLD